MHTHIILLLKVSVSVVCDHACNYVKINMSCIALFQGLQIFVDNSCNHNYHVVIATISKFKKEDEFCRYWFLFANCCSAAV